ncbi:MAG: response regulator [Acidobacteria bacterium]|nr:response regulator [Acidobacteriota bacterium]
MPRCVLLVDDTAFLRSMLREILEQSGAYRVVAEASDGTAALTLAPEIKPDLVITDLIMPSLDGVELTRALARAEPAPRVILAASADQEGAVLNALAAGACDFITKPYAVRDVLRTLGGAPPPPVPNEETARVLLLRIALIEGTPLPRARIRVLRSQCARLGELLGLEGEFAEVLAADAPATLSLILRTRLSAEDARGWAGRLVGVADVVAEPALGREPGLSEKLPLRAASALTGSLRVKASLLDRLLDHLEQMAADRQEVARTLLPARAPSDYSAVDPILRRMDRGISRMRAEIFAARLVPFDRVASRLHRCVEEAGKGSSRRVGLRIQGGEARLDLALLEDVGEILESLLPGIVEAAVGRLDILRQLGRPEEAQLHLLVTRNAQRLCLTLHLPESADTPGVVAMDHLLQERMSKLGGSAAMISENGAWKLEMILPAGVSLVRSYLCQAGKHLFAIPVASVERAVDLPASRIRVSDGRSFWQEDGNEPVPLVRFPRIPWAQADGSSRAGFPGLVYRVGPQRYALAVDAVLGETDVVLRPLKEAGGGGQIAGMALMPDGGIAVVPDLPNLARTR